MAEEHTVRPMRLDDVEPAAEVMINGGWGDRRRFLRFCVERPHVRPAGRRGRWADRGHRRCNEQRAGRLGGHDLRRRGPARSGHRDEPDPGGDRRARPGGLRLAGPAGLAVRAADLRAARLRRRARVPTHRGGAVSAERGPRRPWRSRPRTPARPRLRAYSPDDLPAILAIDAAATGEDRAHPPRDERRSGDGHRRARSGRAGRRLRAAGTVGHPPDRRARARGWRQAARGPPDADGRRRRGPDRPAGRQPGGA